MVKFRYALLLAVGAAMQLAPLSLPVSAADFGGSKDTPFEFVPLWTGLYFGVHGGGALGNTGIHDKFDYVGDPEYKGTASNIGAIGGAQLGYNYQRGHFVFGLEGDVGYLGISASKSANGLTSADNTGHCYAHYADETNPHPYDGQMCAVDAKYSGSSNLYGDLTARFGYLMGRTLFYAKGGAAVLEADFKANYSGGNCTIDNSCGTGQAGNPYYQTTRAASTFSFDHGDTLIGWTAGAGLEYKLSPSWSIKGEYQHFDFGKMSYSYKGCYGIQTTAGSAHQYPTGKNYGVCPAGNSQFDNHYTSTITNGKADVSITADAVKIGINYHFSDDAELR